MFIKCNKMQTCSPSSTCAVLVSMSHLGRCLCPDTWPRNLKSLGQSALQCAHPPEHITQGSNLTCIILLLSTFYSSVIHCLVYEQVRLVVSRVILKRVKTVHHSKLYLNQQQQVHCLRSPAVHFGQTMQHSVMQDITTCFTMYDTSMTEYINIHTIYICKCMCLFTSTNTCTSTVSFVCMSTITMKLDRMCT